MSLMEEQKEMTLELNELRRKVADSKRNNLDLSKWREWDSEQVFVLIMRVVNGDSLKKYRDRINGEAIRAQVIESEYCGQALEGISQEEIRALGIKNILVRRAVLTAIQELVQGSNQIADPAAAEGVNVEAAPTAYL